MRASRAALLRAAHDMKGQAATFNYPLIARVAGSLSKLIGELPADKELPLGLVDAHVSAIHVIYRDKVMDESNKIARGADRMELEARGRRNAVEQALAASDRISSRPGVSISGEDGPRRMADASGAKKSPEGCQFITLASRLSILADDGIGRPDTRASALRLRGARTGAAAPGCCIAQS